MKADVRPPTFSPAPSIRRAAADDLADLVAVEATAFTPSWSAEQLRSALAAPGSLALVVADGAVAGYALFLIVADEAELLRLATTPPHRRRGIAAALARAGLERLAAAGVRRCHLEVRAGNAPALALYRQLGFAETGRRRRYYDDGEDALLLARDVP